MKSWLHDNSIEIYSAYNKGKSVAAERFIRTLKNHMTAVSKNVYNDKLDEMVDKYNKTCHRTIKIKPTDVKVDNYIDKDPRFKVGDHVGITEIFLKRATLQIGLRMSL